MLLAAFVTQVGALQTAPILIAVITAFLAIESVKFNMRLLEVFDQARDFGWKVGQPAQEARPRLPRPP